MESQKKYRLYCDTDSKYEHVTQDESIAVPTVCPGDAGHTIDQDKTAVVETIDPRKDRILLLAEVLADAEPITQLPRMLDALDKYSSVLAALDGKNYGLADVRITKAKDAGDITQADKDLIEAKFPPGWNS